MARQMERAIHASDVNASNEESVENFYGAKKEKHNASPFYFRVLYNE